MGPVATATLIIKGLVFNVDVRNSASYVGSGASWNDLSGSNHGTLTSGPLFKTGNGGSIVFDGIDDVVSFGNILNMGLTRWTKSCWVKFDGAKSINWFNFKSISQTNK